MSKMKYLFYTPSALLLATNTIAYAQDITSTVSSASVTKTATPSITTSVPESDEDRLICYKQCFEAYGSKDGCGPGFTDCWCTNDWTEGEEDCIWDACGVDAHNGKT